MRNHVLRPLYVALGVVALILLARSMIVPPDFKAQRGDFTFGFHRASNVDEWKAVPIKYRGKESCAECHEENVEEHASSPHSTIECENCHGPAINHPDNPEALEIDKSRAQCLRCHADLPYPSSHRSEIAGIDPADHNASSQCIECHQPHNPDLENM